LAAGRTAFLDIEAKAQSEKWAPVFERIAREIKRLELHPGSIRMDAALAPLSTAICGGSLGDIDGSARKNAVTFLAITQIPILEVAEGGGAKLASAHDLTCSPMS
jgi:hypothetical protein